jgi:quercetin dioxygenase-like cupin family protein
VHYDWDEVPEEPINADATRQVIHTPNMTLLRAQFKKGAVLPLHAHPQEQITMVTHGELRIEVEGVSTVLTAGGILFVPSNANHLVEAVEDTVSIDVFSPARTDWQR